MAGKLLGGDLVHRLAKADRRHRADHRLRGDRLQAQRLVQAATRSQRQVAVRRHVGRPAARVQTADDADRLGQSKECGRVERALPVELAPEHRSVGARVVPAVAGDEGPHVGAAIRADAEHAGALRAAQPLVPVGGPVRGAESANVDRHHARRVCGVDQRVDAEAAELADDRLDREHQAARARHVAHEREARPGRDDLEHVEVPGHDGAVQALLAGLPVLVVVGQELVAGPEPK